MRYTIKTAIGSYLIAAALCAGTSVEYARAGAPEGYYNSLHGKCGYELMVAIKNVARNHKVISYGDNTWNAFRSTDVKVVNGVEYWYDMYSDNLVAVSSGHGGMNIEHSVANSWWEGTKNDAYKDIVHLNPSDATANNRKSNYPLGEIGTVTWENGVTFVGNPKSGSGGGSSYVYEPCDDYKGDFARVFMYIFTIYRDMEWGTRFTWMYDDNDDLMFKPWAQEMLLRWSANDPVSSKERNRNDGIYKEQKNRNPFIDLPDLADHIWGDKKNVPYVVEGYTPGGGGDDPHDPQEPEEGTTIYNWLASNSSSLSAGWEFENVSLSDGVSYVWQWKEYKGNHYLNGSSYVSNKALPAEAYAWSPEVDLTNAETVTLTFQHAAKFQTTLRDLCKVAVKDMDSNSISYVNINTWPAPDTWNFSSAGNMDLSEFSGKKVKIGLLYKSTKAGADTWEINDMQLTVKQKSSGVEELPVSDGEGVDESVLVEVWGNNILVPEGASIFDMNGRRVSGTNLSRGVYVVVKPGFKKAVKVLVK